MFINEMGGKVRRIIFALTNFASDARNLYNGNISSQVTSIYGMQTLGKTYHYDQLQRLKQMRVYRKTNAANTWENEVATTDYFNTFSYDKNGNIKTLFRNAYAVTTGNTVGLGMDNFTYNYVDFMGNSITSSPGNLNRTNRLGSVDDAESLTSSLVYGDIQHNMVANNYSYDKLGQLTRDIDENISNIVWRAGDKKISQITKTNGEIISFKYNPFGQRILKKVVTSASTKLSYYSYDANGQVMGVYDIYDLQSSYGSAVLSELHIYGASRLGMLKANKQVFTNVVLPPVPTDYSTHRIGIKYYEISNYLGNVEVVITDRKTVSGQILENSTFETSLNAWNTNAQSSVLHNLSLQRIDVSTTVNSTSGVFKIIPTVNGQKYTVSITANKGNAPNLELFVGGVSYPLVNNSTTSIEFTASSGSTQLVIRPTNFLASYTYFVEDVMMVTDALYAAVVINTSDYYPGGMLMPGRHSSSADYRFGYNGMEMDNEPKGNGNSYTTEFRQYDPRLMRWLSLDPLMAKYPNMSPYVAFNNNPIYFIDPLGLEGGPAKEKLGIPGDDGKPMQLGDKSLGLLGSVINGEFNGHQEVPEMKVTPTFKQKYDIHYKNVTNNYIRDWNNLNINDKRLFILGAMQNSKRPFSYDASVRTDDMPLFVPAGGFGNWGIYEEFVHGVGPVESVFFEGHKATQELKNSNSEISRLRKEVFDKFGGNKNKLIEYATSNNGKVYTSFRSHKGSFMPWDEHGNTAQFIGTFSADVVYDAITDRLIFVVSDSKSAKSLFLHLADNKERSKNKRTKYGNTYQKYIWSESMESFKNFK